MRYVMLKHVLRLVCHGNGMLRRVLKLGCHGNGMLKRVLRLGCHDDGMLKRVRRLGCIDKISKIYLEIQNNVAIFAPQIYIVDIFIQIIFYIVT